MLFNCHTISFLSLPFKKTRDFCVQKLFCILCNLTSTPLKLANCTWVSNETILTTEALYKTEAVAVIPLPDVFLLGTANFHKAAPIILYTASLDFSFPVKPTANNAETAAWFNVPFNFHISICHIFFYPLKLTETCLFVLSLCLSLYIELCCAADSQRFPDAMKLQAVLSPHHAPIFLNVEHVQISSSHAMWIKFCHR